jgi:hypothetical protein
MSNTDTGFPFIFITGTQGSITVSIVPIVKTGKLRLRLCTALPPMPLLLPLSLLPRSWQCVKNALSWVPVAHTCNPSCSGGRDPEDHGSKPAWGNNSQDPISKKLITIKDWWSRSKYRL